MEEARNEQNNEKKKAGANDYLANERTFLAWIRTSIAIMGFGFVVVKFSLFIKQLSFALDKGVVIPSKGYSSVIGISLVALGGLMALFSFIRFRNIQKQLDTNSYFPSLTLSLLLTLFITVICVILILYLIPNI